LISTKARKKLLESERDNQMFPAKQYMESSRPEQDIRQHLAADMALFGATDADIRITEISPDSFPEFYTLEWYTFKGYRVYMWHTGILVGEK
jgi:hypothetical protein